LKQSGWRGRESLDPSLVRITRESIGVILLAELELSSLEDLTNKITNLRPNQKTKPNDFLASTKPASRPIHSLSLPKFEPNIMK
jgi:hypothetical protein